MKAGKTQVSLNRRWALAMGIAVTAGILVSGAILRKFRDYENNVQRMMSGDQKTVLLGHQLEARVKAAEELVDESLSSEESNQAFLERIRGIVASLESFTKPQELKETKAALASLVQSRSEAPQDLFVSYRNVKTAAFNIYRLSWSNKWMSVAKAMGIIINELDNVPYASGEKTAASVISKIAAAGAIIARSELTQGSKLFLMEQLSGLKAQVTAYGEAIARFEKMRSKRREALNEIGAALKKFNELQGRGTIRFLTESHVETLEAFVLFAGLIAFSFLWWLISVHLFKVGLQRVSAHISRQMAGWVSPGGTMAMEGFAAPKRIEAEFAGAYDSLDQVIRRVNLLRKEDILVKRLLSVPALLVNRGKQAVFWNSAFCLLGRTRSLEESGPLNHKLLLRFWDDKEQDIDPIERAMSQKETVSERLFLRVGQESIAVHVSCTPVLPAQGDDPQADYVMVYIRDMREEHQRLSDEIDRQLRVLRESAAQFKQGDVPSDPLPGTHRLIHESVADLKQQALERQERDTILVGQAETMRDRMEREAHLKKTVHGRMEKLKDEVSESRKELSKLWACVNALSSHLSQMESRDKALRSSQDEIKKQGTGLLQDLSKIEALLSKSVDRLGVASGLSKRMKDSEHLIEKILSEASLANVNNGIIGAKKELTVNDVMTVTGHVSQIIGQFERVYECMKQAASEIETGMASLSADLREGLVQATAIAAHDQAVMQGVLGATNNIQAEQEEMARLASDLALLKTIASKVSAQVSAVEEKLSRMTQIGQASLSLQSQLENGFRGLSSYVKNV